MCKECCFCVEKIEDDDCYVKDEFGDYYHLYCKVMEEDGRIINAEHGG